MGKAALIFIGVLTVASVTVGLGTYGSLMDSDRRLANDQYEILARNAALAGLERAEQELADGFGDTDFSGTYEGVSYTTTADVSGNHAVVTSKGTATSGEDREIDFVVRAEYEKVSVPVMAEQAPSFMRYAVISEDDLQLSGDVDAEVFGDADVTLNANMHSNGRIHINGNAARVRGYGTYVTSQSVNKPDKIFQPNYVVEENPSVLYAIEPVTIPDLVPADLYAFYDGIGANVVTPSFSGGTFTLQGDVDFGGERNDPAIVYVPGDVVAESATITGYTMFIVEGGVDFRGNVQAGPTDYDESLESSVAFYSGDGMRLRGNATVWGQVFSHSGVEFYSGTPTVYGSVTTKGAIDFRGNVNVNYVPASPALTTVWSDHSVTRIKRIAYSEW